MKFPEKGPSALWFNLLFWTPFWLLPLVSIGVRPELNYPPKLYASHALGSLLITAGLAGLAELCGRRRRYFFLIAGLLCWLGVQIWTVFLAASSDFINTYTIATVGQYIHGDGTERSYIYINYWNLLPLVATYLPFVLLWRNWGNLDWPRSWRGVAVGVALAFSLLPLDRFNRHRQGLGDDGQLANAYYRIDLFAPGDTYYQFYLYWQQRAQMRRYQRQSPLVTRTSTTPLTLIVLVGESTSRQHMSLYGYCRNTTPVLDGLKKNLDVFDNLISNFTVTVFAIYNLFSMPGIPTTAGPERSTLFNLLAAGGFHTEWISNQYKNNGPFDVLTTITSASQKQAWVKNPHARRGVFSDDDAVLLPWIEKSLKNPAPLQASFFHMMGTHFTYSDRYPAGFAKPWPPHAAARTPHQKMIIDNYDTAMRYHDQILGRIFRLAAAHGENRNIALVYLSDHGDEAYDQQPMMIHAYPNVTRAMVDIPMLVWLSPALQRSRPDLARAVAAARHARLQTRDVAPLLLDLASVQTKGDVLKHPLRPGFQEGTRMVTRYDYDRDPGLGRAPLLAPLCH